VLSPALRRPSLLACATVSLVVALAAAFWHPQGGPVVRASLIMGLVTVAGDSLLIVCACRAAGRGAMAGRSWPALLGAVAALGALEGLLRVGVSALPESALIAPVVRACWVVWCYFAVQCVLFEGLGPLPALAGSARLLRAGGAGHLLSRQQALIGCWPLVAACMAVFAAGAVAEHAWPAGVWVAGAGAVGLLGVLVTCTAMTALHAAQAHLAARGCDQPHIAANPPARSRPAGRNPA
jgi:hypothetical protein